MKRLALLALSVFATSFTMLIAATTTQAQSPDRTQTNEILIPDSNRPGNTRNPGASVDENVDTSIPAATPANTDINPATDTTILVPNGNRPGNLIEPSANSALDDARSVQSSQDSTSVDNIQQRRLDYLNTAG